MLHNSVFYLHLTQAKSVQEKLAEAILKEIQSHSEPELSDTSTETEEDPTEKNQQQETAAEPGSDVPLQQETSRDYGKSEEGLVKVAVETHENEDEEMTTIDNEREKVEEVPETGVDVVKDEEDTDEENAEEGEVQGEEKSEDTNTEKDMVADDEKVRLDESEKEDDEKAALIDDELASKENVEQVENEEILKVKGKLENSEMGEEDKTDGEGKNQAEKEADEETEEELLNENIADSEEGEQMKTSDIQAQESIIQESKKDKDELFKESETLVSRDEMEKKDSGVDAANGETTAALEVLNETRRQGAVSSSQAAQGKENTESDDTPIEKDMEAETMTDELNKVVTEEDAKDLDTSDKFDENKVDQEADTDNSNEEAMPENPEEDVNDNEIEEPEEPEEPQENSEQKSMDRTGNITIESENSNPDAGTENLVEGNISGALTQEAMNTVIWNQLRTLFK
ncbi:hypothetical protein UPYG_G00036870 [Umbra pygmaea]|uniref:Uncharacterized protein n=1 Tax=Umbra pygmaea TaxID=75934 RepID=A0ABD0XP32_UMBPY